VNPRLCALAGGRASRDLVGLRTLTVIEKTDSVLCDSQRGQLHLRRSRYSCVRWQHSPDHLRPGIGFHLPDFLRDPLSHRSALDISILFGRWLLSVTFSEGETRRQG
jgi:hypothetical protein